MITHHARMAWTLSRQLGLPDEVSEALLGAYEQWDGRGWPGTLRGEQVPIASRLAQLSEYVEVAHRVGGAGAVMKLARERGGKQFDPRIAELVGGEAAMLLADLDSIPSWAAVIDAEPALAVVLSGERLDTAFEAIADFVDLKSPYFLGHSSAVAALAAAAGEQFGLSAPDLRALRRAALLHDLGRLGISNAILDKRGPLGAGEQERMRLYPHITERMLRRSAALAPLGAIAVQHRERLDGTGYPRGLAGGAISGAARILAAADVYEALVEPRPHRPARPASEAALVLQAEVRDGHLDAEAVQAVLTAAGHTARRRRQGPAGLTEREVDVLRLLARGFSNKEIASRLVISRKTVGKHVEHIYAKIGASNRAAASLFAVQHGLLPEAPPTQTPEPRASVN